VHLVAKTWKNERNTEGSIKRSSSARSEKMERFGDRQEKIEGYCSTGQSPKRAAVTIEISLVTTPTT
jgi:hypothetical protein